MVTAEQTKNNINKRKQFFLNPQIEKVHYFTFCFSHIPAVVCGFNLQYGGDHTIQQFYQIKFLKNKNKKKTTTYFLPVGCKQRVKYETFSEVLEGYLDNCQWRATHHYNNQ